MPSPQQAETTRNRRRPGPREHLPEGNGHDADHGGPTRRAHRRSKRKPRGTEAVWNQGSICQRGTAKTVNHGGLTRLAIATASRNHEEPLETRITGTTASGKWPRRSTTGGQHDWPFVPAGGNHKKLGAPASGQKPRRSTSGGQLEERITQQ